MTPGQLDLEPAPAPTRAPRAAAAPSREFTITCVRREPLEGFWTAHVTAGGETVHVDRRYGSWHAVRGTRRAEVLPHVAAALQQRVRRLERNEREATS